MLSDAKTKPAYDKLEEEYDALPAVFGKIYWQPYDL